MRIATFPLAASVLLLLALEGPVNADTAYLQQTVGPPLACEAVIFREDANGTAGLRLSGGMFVTELLPSTKAGNVTPHKKPEIMERWKQAGWTANVITGTKRVKVFNCAIDYPPPKGMWIMGEGPLPADYFKLEHDEASTVVQFADVDRIIAAPPDAGGNQIIPGPNRKVSVILRSGAVLVGKIATAPLQNGELQPVFHGVLRFSQLNPPIWFTAEFSEIKEIQFEKRVEPQPLTAFQLAALKPVKLDNLRLGINVVLLKDCRFTEEGMGSRIARAGEIYNLASYSSVRSDVELFARNQSGKMITVKVPLDAIALANP